MPRFPLVGKTPSKVSNIYICVYLVFMKIYMHISRGSSLYSSNLVNLFIPYSEIFKKMSKFFQSSIPSLPYAECVKLT